MYWNKRNSIHTKENSVKPFYCFTSISERRLQVARAIHPLKSRQIRNTALLCSWWARAARSWWAGAGWWRRKARTPQRSSRLWKIKWWNCVYLRTECNPNSSNICVVYLTYPLSVHSSIKGNLCYIFISKSLYLSFSLLIFKNTPLAPNPTNTPLSLKSWRWETLRTSGRCWGSGTRPRTGSGPSGLKTRHNC